ncbi:MAG: hypothetical protein H7315_05410 [Herminiimonas sp.]|nr:hypothetical protein [Herminiimonas sp.]
MAQTQQAPHLPQAWAYFGWWLPQSWRDAPLDRLDRLLFFELKVNAAGVVAERNGWPDDWVGLRAAVKKAGVPLDLTLTLFDARAFEALFSSADATARLLDEAAALASHDEVAGLQIDFEIYSHVRPATVVSYQRFVRALASRLRAAAPARKISVFFPMGGETILYDRTTLAQVDHVVLQGYDAHWTGSKAAGPVAPLAGGDAVTWKKAVAQGVARGVPPDQLIIGFPLYGVEWPVATRKVRSATTGAGVHTSFAPIVAAATTAPVIEVNVQEQVRQYGAVHDAASGSAYYQFKKPGGQFVEGWFEDWWTLDLKHDYLMQERLGGIAFFVLGYDNGQLIEHFLQRRVAGFR